MNLRGDTLYPAGNNVTFDIHPDELAGRGTGFKSESKQKKKKGQGRRTHAQEQVTLNDILQMLSQLTGQALIDRLGLLESRGLYRRLI